MPNNPRSRILVIDDDLQSLDLINKQVLEPLGYVVTAAADGATGLQMAITNQPEVVILSLSIRGLSGKDVLTAFRSQRFDSPVIVIVPEYSEGQALAAFRLGARDYLVRPLREAEIVAAVDRVVEDGRLRRERATLQQQLTQANADLEQRVRELTTLSGIGKAVTNLSDVSTLFNRLVESAVFVASAEMGWMVLNDEASGQLLMAAAKNLPGRVQPLQPWDDGAASLVKISGEPLNISGAGLANMKISQIARSALVVPIKAREQTVGVITVANRAAQPFSDRNQVLLSAVADYASIAIVNMRLFQALEQRAKSMQQSYEDVQAEVHRRGEVLTKLSQELRGPVAQAKSAVDLALNEIGGKLKDNQRAPLKNASDKLGNVWQMVEDISLLHDSSVAGAQTFKPVRLDDLAKQALAKYQALAQQNKVALLANIPNSIIVPGDGTRLNRVFEALISNAIKFSPNGGEVTVSLQRDGNTAQIVVSDRGMGIHPDQISRIFERFYQIDPKTPGTGMGLALVKEIVEAHGGQVWVESAPLQGSRFYFTLPKAI
jgi:signal transduction histidine kinase/DNA-binding response OmpR family regulator